jgi:hypothetical protein
LLKIGRGDTVVPLQCKTFAMEWPLRHQNLYRIFTPTEDDLSVLRGYVLVEVNEEGEVEDTMRIAIHSESVIRISFRSEVMGY